MIGSIWWNFIGGAIAFVFTFFAAAGSNLPRTSLTRSTVSFIVLFILMFLFRWLLGTVIGLKRMQEDSITESLEDGDEAHKGTNIDIVTPDDDQSLQQMMKGQLNSKSQDDPFIPLNPPQLVTKNNLDPSQLAQAVRRLTEDEG